MVSRQSNRKLYRTMQGRMVDIEKLRASNENVKAVGNMSVNARGDVIGAGGQIIKSKEDQMKEYYDAPKGQVSDARTRTVKVAIFNTFARLIFTLINRKGIIINVAPIKLSGLIIIDRKIKINP